MPRQCLSLSVTHFSAFVGNLQVWRWAPWVSHGFQDDRKIVFHPEYGCPWNQGLLD